MKTAAIVQARMGSTRLPGKVLMEIEGQTVLQRLIDRLSLSKELDQIIVATGFDFANDEIRRWCYNNDITYHSGPEDDVLQRVLITAQFYKVDRIVDITGDCPLVDYRHIDSICQDMGVARYGSNIIPRTWPDGFDVQVFSTETLEAVDATLAFDDPLREHVGWTVYSVAKGLMKYNYIAPLGKRYPLWGLTLDTQEDLELIEQVFRYFLHKDFSAIEVIEFIEANKHLLDINSHIQRKEPA